MKITALDHIQLAMPAGEERQARRFYSEILGLPELAKPAPLASRGGCWFGTEMIQLHMGVEEPFQPARKAHPALAVHDLDELARRLEKAGYEVKWDDSVPSVRRFFCNDPFGNRIEFLREGDRFLD